MKKKILFIIIILLLFTFESVQADSLKATIELKCHYTSQPQVSPRESADLLLRCEKQSDGKNGCNLEWSFYNFPSSQIYFYETITPENMIDQVQCPGNVNIFYTLAEEEYDGRYDNVGYMQSVGPLGNSAWARKTFGGAGKIQLENQLALTEVSSKANLSKNSCGSGAGMISGIPIKITELSSMAITIIYVVIPIILVIMGTIDLFKGVIAQKEDEIKKGQQMFIKRLIVAVIIFFVVVIVKLLISIVADGSKNNIVDCIDCFISNKCNNEITMEEYNEL